MQSWVIFFRTLKLVLQRRLALLFNKPFDPYPPVPEGIYLSPSDMHFQECKSAPLKFARKHMQKSNVSEWQSRTRQKLVELTGYKQSSIPAKVLLSATEPIKNNYYRHSFYIRDQWGVDLPVQAVWKEQAKKSDLPVIICLQGTNSGFHLSWGQERFPPDPVKINRGSDYAIQAAKQGYLAICLEVSCFGLRRERKLDLRSPNPCIGAANRLILLGRCLLGDRASDVSSLITWIILGEHNLPALRTEISVMGQSSGGSIALYAGAMDSRISAIVATGCIGFIRRSIAARDDPSGQNVVPGILNWMETDDVIGLCAPRPFLTVSGEKDHIWPISDGIDVVNSARKTYEEFGAGHKINAISVDGPHRFYPAETWSAFKKITHEEQF